MTDAPPHPYSGPVSRAIAYGLDAVIVAATFTGAAVVIGMIASVIGAQAHDLAQAGGTGARLHQHQSSARPQHAQHLAQRGVTLAQVLKDLMRVHDVEGAFGPADVVDVALLEADVGESLFRGAAAGVREHGRGQVEADDGSRNGRGGAASS
jgi:hypothetical protein